MPTVKVLVYNILSDTRIKYNFIDTFKTDCYFTYIINCVFI